MHTFSTVSFLTKLLAGDLLHNLGKKNCFEEMQMCTESTKSQIFVSIDVKRLVVNSFPPYSSHGSIGENRVSLLRSFKNRDTFLRGICISTKAVSQPSCTEPELIT